MKLFSAETCLDFMRKISSVQYDVDTGGPRSDTWRKPQSPARRVTVWTPGPLSLPQSSRCLSTQWTSKQQYKYYKLINGPVNICFKYLQILHRFYIITYNRVISVITYNKGIAYDIVITCTCLYYDSYDCNRLHVIAVKLVHPWTDCKCIVND